MKMEVEAVAPISFPAARKIERAISRLRSHGPSSFASITNERGSYLQVAGGGASCMLELFDAETNQRYRAFTDRSNPLKPDGTILDFGAGSLVLRSDEWLLAKGVVEAFLAFNDGASLPSFIHWRPAPGF